MRGVVGAIVSVQHDAFFVPAIHDGGDNGADAGPARRKVAEGGIEGQASCGFCAGDCYWWA